MNNIQIFFRQIKTLEYDLVRLNERELEIMLMALMVYLPSLIIANWIGGGIPANVQYINFVGLALNVFIFILLKRGYFKLAVYITWSLSFLAIVTIVAMIGTIRTPSTSVFILWILGSIFVFGFWGMVASVALSSLSILALIIAENEHLLPKPEYSVSINQWVSFSLVFIIVGLFFYYRQYTILSQLQKTRSEFEQRLRAQVTAQMHENRFQLISENTADLIWVFNTKSLKIVFVGPGVDEMLGYSAQEVRELPYQKILTEETYARVLEYLPKRVATLEHGKISKTYSDEFGFIHKNGTVVYTEVNTSFITNEFGEIEVIGVTRDITERKKAEERLRESEERYRRAISAAGAVPYVLDYKKMVYTFIGEGFEKLTSIKINDMTSDKWMTTLLDYNLRGALEGLQLGEAIQKMRSGEISPSIPWTSDFKIRDKNGEIRWIADSAVQVISDTGQVTGSIGILWDVTDRKQAEITLRESRDRLREANLELERASRIKDEFLASMSHELRTPLTSILTFSQSLLLDTYGRLDEKQQYAVKNVENNGRHLLGLINDILDLAKIEAGKLDFQYQSCSVVELCNASMQLTKGLAHQKRQKIEFTISHPAMTIKADARRMKQILINLLSNAIKFTPDEGRLGLEVTGDVVGQVVKITVWDEGIGISDEDLPRLFQPFVQLDSSLARQSEGTGLGLTLVKRMTELQGGSISVLSRLGEGSRFTVILPWKDQVAGGESVPVELAGIHNVLIVDDGQPDSTEIMTGLRGYSVQSLRIGTKQLFDVMVLQYYRPDFVILHFTQFGKKERELVVKLLGSLPDRPILILAGEKALEEASQRFPEISVAWPLSTQALIREINRVSKNHRANPDAQAHLLANHKSTILFVDDNQTILESVSDFLGTQNYEVVSCGSGKEALKLVVDSPPDLVLMDIQMPEMDGLEVIRQIRASNDPELAGMKIIALTALAMQGDRERCLEAGADDYISKPLVLEKLLDIIERNLPGKITGELA